MIVISPYARKLQSGKKNPKDYPCWKELIALIDEPIIQVGVEGEEPLVSDFRTNLSLEELAELIKACRTWISVDSFFQHYACDIGKPGIVLWGQSDPNIFGHPENINLLKSREYLRDNQFWNWELCENRHDCWVTPEVISEFL